MSDFISALLRLIQDAILSLVNPLLKRSTVLKYAGVIGKVFGVVDPVIAKNLGKLAGSDIYQIIRFAVVSLADQRLSDAEVSAIAEYVIAKFDIRILADKAIAPQKPPEVLKQEIDDAIADFKEKQAALLPPVSLTPVATLGRAADLGIVSKSYTPGGGK